MEEGWVCKNLQRRHESLGRAAGNACTATSMSRMPKAIHRACKREGHPPPLRPAAHQHHTALDALLSLRRGEERVDLRGWGEQAGTPVGTQPALSRCPLPEVCVMRSCAVEQTVSFKGKARYTK